MRTWRKRTWRKIFLFVVASFLILLYIKNGYSLFKTKGTVVLDTETVTVKSKPDNSKIPRSKKVSCVLPKMNIYEPMMMKFDQSKY